MSGSAVLWQQTWLVVVLGMASVFAFLLLVVMGMSVMSFFAKPVEKAGAKG